MDIEEILMREYEACQSHNNSLDSQAWISISIIITVNVLVLIQVVSNLVLTTVPENGWSNLMFTVFIAIVMIVISIIFWRWYRRIEFLRGLNRDRMHQIENVLGIHKNLRVRGLDLLRRKNKDQNAQNEWKMLFPRQRNYIEQLNQRLDEKGDIWKYRRPTTEGFPKFKCIFPLLIIVWLIMIVFEGLLYIDAIYKCLFDL